MKLNVLILSLFIFLISALNSTEKDEISIAENDSNIKSRFYFTLGIGVVKINSTDRHFWTRSDIKYQRDKFIYALDISTYDPIRFFEVPFRKGALLNRSEAGFTLNRVFLIPYEYRIFCLSLGSGITWIHRTVRDEQIFYETWTRKTDDYIGIPIETNLLLFSKYTHFFLNLCYKGVLCEKEIYHGYIIDIGFWFDRK